MSFCGIGNPQAFRKTLESLGANVVQFRVFDDHHLYTTQEVRQINAVAQEFMAEAMITTEKDARKLSPDAFDLPLTALAVEIDILRGEKALDTRLREVVHRLVQVPDAAAAP